VVLGKYDDKHVEGSSIKEALLVLDRAKDATVMYKCPKLGNTLGVQEDCLII